MERRIWLLRVRRFPQHRRRAPRGLRSWPMRRTGGQSTPGGYIWSDTATATSRPTAKRVRTQNSSRPWPPTARCHCRPPPRHAPGTVPARRRHRRCRVAPPWQTTRTSTVADSAASPGLVAHPRRMHSTQDGCTAQQQTEQNGSALVQQWTHCMEATDVESITYPGWDHAWPAARTRGDSPPVATLMWIFLSQHHTAVATITVKFPSMPRQPLVSLRVSNNRSNG